MKKLILVFIGVLSFSVAIAESKSTNAKPEIQSKTENKDQVKKSTGALEASAKGEVKKQTGALEASAKGEVKKQTGALEANAKGEVKKQTGALEANAKGEVKKQTGALEANADAEVKAKTKQAEKVTNTAKSQEALVSKKPQTQDTAKTKKDKEVKDEKNQTIIVNLGEKKPEKKPDSGWHGSLGMNLLHSWNVGDIKEGEYTQINFVDKDKRLKGLGSEIYLTFEHPIPVLPNFKFQYTGLRTSKDGKSSVFDSIKGDVAAVLYADNEGEMNNKGFIDYSHIDATLYYRLVPADIAFQFDLGLTARYFIYPLNRLIPATPKTAITSATADGTENRTYQIMPMIYVDMTGIVPDTGLSFTLAGNFMVLNKENYMNDWKLGMKYTMEFVPYAHPGIEFGYRYLGIHSTTKYKKTGKTFTTDLHNNQIYAGIFVSF